MKIYLCLFILLFSTNNLFAIWKSIEGPFNANTFCLVSNGDNIIAGTNDGILVSSNNGNSYSKLDNELNGMLIVSLKIMPNNKIIASAAYNGIFTSADNGETWQARNEGLSEESSLIYGIYIDQDKIYLATHDGIYLSDDNAESWQDISGNMLMRSTSKIAALDNVLLAGRSQGLHISRDGGKNWNVIAQMAEYNVVETITIHKNIIYAIVRIGGFAALSGVFVSKDYGETWKDISTGLLGSLRDIFVTDDYIFVASNRGLQITEHEIVKWKNISRDTIDGNYVYTIDNVDLYSVILHKGKIIIGSDGGIFSSENMGNTWELNIPVMSGKEVFSIEMQGNSLYVGTDSGLYLSEDMGRTWKNLTKAIGNQTIRAILFADNNIYIGASFGLYFSSNNGESWDKQDFGLDKSVAVSALLKIGNNLFASSYYEGVLMSSNNGNSWVKMNSGMSDPRVIQLNNIGNTIFTGIVGAHPGIYSSDDFGNSWTECSLYQNWSYSPWVYSIAIRDKSIFIGTGWNGIYKSDDLGKTWQEKNNGPSEMRTHDVFSIALKDNFLLATTAKNESKNKLFVSTDSGENWVHGDMEGIQNVNIRKIFIMDAYVFAGAQGTHTTNYTQIYTNKIGGFYYAKVSDLINATSVIDNSTAINDINIFPNPASDFITIHLNGVNPTVNRGVENTDIVKIYDVLGVEMMTTPSAVAATPPKDGNLRIDVSHLSTGIYFIKIGANVEKFVKL
jgi:photosystem II stability/assembly factor-like uncharacterized protein